MNQNFLNELIPHEINMELKQNLLEIGKNSKKCRQI